MLSAVDKDLAQSRDDLIRSSLARFHRAFEITLSVDGSVFAAEMDAVLRFSLDSGEADILTDLPVAVAAETVRITRPPIDYTEASSDCSASPVETAFESNDSLRFAIMNRDRTMLNDNYKKRAC